MKPVFVLTLLMLALHISIAGQSTAEAMSPADQYIRQHAMLAVEEMYQHRIPASIKLAQGMLESGLGKSRLATEGRNHFGIKCKTTWEGETILERDDDFDEAGNLLESCFRKYEKVEASYRDHSLFLTGSPRYSALFLLEVTDYAGWAEGLKRCGYATNPQYHRLLIDLIERHHLFVFDRIPADALADCLDYYDTHRYVSDHQRIYRDIASSEHPSSVRLPKNYKGGWLRENTRMRIINTLLSASPSSRTTSEAKIAQEKGFLAFQISAEEDAIPE
jgi:hypothetical protein